MMATKAPSGDSAGRFLQAIAAENCIISDRDDASHLVTAIPEFNIERLGASSDSRIIVSGWNEIKGVLAFSGTSSDRDGWQASVAASNERALRDLLLNISSRSSGILFLSGQWTLATVRDIFRGDRLPDRIGYLATPDSFAQLPAHSGRHPDVEVCTIQPLGGSMKELRVSEYADLDSTRLAEEIGLATQEALAQSSAVVVTFLTADQTHLSSVLEVLGYQPFYRVQTFRGTKRGPSGGYERNVRRAGGAQNQDLPLLSKDAPLVHKVRALRQPEERRLASSYLAEGLTLVARAIDDGLPVEVLLCRGELLAGPEGAGLVDAAGRAGIPCFRCSDGLMGTITTTRPLPRVVAAIHHAVQDVKALRIVSASTFLAVEDVQNPDNLGMVLRTADAAGIDAVVVTQAGADPLHKNCVRAARGAVGRLPLYISTDLVGWLRGLAQRGFSILGGTAHGDANLYDQKLDAPMVVVVGNEESGLHPETLAACTVRVQIPMAPGQSSLNVGVAAGVLLYELVRQGRCN